MVSIDTIAVENEVANNMYQRSELDYLIYNDPAAYADLILNGDPEAYLKAVTQYKPLDWFSLSKLSNKSHPVIQRGSSCFGKDLFMKSFTLAQ